MEYWFTQTVDEKKKTYLFAYYHHPLWGLVRRTGGPFIILVSLVELLFLRDGRLWVFSLFCALFGVLYILLPFLRLARLSFDQEELILSLDAGLLNISGKAGNTVIRRENIKSLSLVKRHLRLDLRLGAALSLFIPLANIDRPESFIEEMERQFSVTLAG